MPSKSAYAAAGLSGMAKSIHPARFIGYSYIAHVETTSKWSQAVSDLSLFFVGSKSTIIEWPRSKRSLDRLATSPAASEIAGGPGLFDRELGDTLVSRRNHPLVSLGGANSGVRAKNE